VPRLEVAPEKGRHPPKQHVALVVGSPALVFLIPGDHGLPASGARVDPGTVEAVSLEPLVDARAAARELLQPE
jgi:hypothetical protein